MKLTSLLSLALFLFVSHAAHSMNDSEEWMDIEKAEAEKNHLLFNEYMQQLNSPLLMLPKELLEKIFTIVAGVELTSTDIAYYNESHFSDPCCLSLFIERNMKNVVYPLVECSKTCKQLYIFCSPLINVPGGLRTGLEKRHLSLCEIIGKDPCVHDNARWSALHWAAHRGNIPVLKVLLSGDDAEKLLFLQSHKGRTALHVAAMTDRLAVVIELLRAAGPSAGKLLRAKNNEGLTALQEVLKLQLDWCHMEYLLKRAEDVYGREENIQALMTFLNNTKISEDGVIDSSSSSWWCIIL